MPDRAVTYFASSARVLPVAFGLVLRSSIAGSRFKVKILAASLDKLGMSLDYEIHGEPVEP
jgi:hypothetical protein